MKKNFYWFACFACATVALAFSSCNDDKIEPDIEVPTEMCIRDRANPAPIVAPIFAMPIPAAACNKIVDNLVL